jgi:hypothetical protein
MNFNYSIPFSICHNTTKRKELFSLKVLSSDCGILHNLNSTAVNEDIFIKNLQPLHLHTYSCKYETATYLKMFLILTHIYASVVYLIA